MKKQSIAVVALAAGCHLAALAAVEPFPWFEENAATFTTALGARGYSGNGYWDASDTSVFGETELAAVEDGKIALDTANGESVEFRPGWQFARQDVVRFEAEACFDAANASLASLPLDKNQAGVSPVKSGDKAVFAYLSGGEWQVSEVEVAMDTDLTILFTLDYVNRTIKYEVRNGETTEVIAAAAALPYGNAVSSVAFAGYGKVTSFAAAYDANAVAKIGDKPYESLVQAVWDAPAGGTVVLQEDTLVGQTIDVRAGADVTVDLNGKTVGSSMTGNDYAFYALDGAKLVLSNGTIDVACRGVCSEGVAELRGVTLTSHNRPLGVYYAGAKAGDKTIDRAGYMLIDADTTVTQAADGTGSCVLFIQGSQQDPYDGVARADIYGKLIDLNPDNDYGTITENAGKPSKVKINVYDGAEITSAYGLALYNTEGGEVNLFGGTVNGNMVFASGTLNVPEDSTAVVSCTRADGTFAENTMGRDLGHAVTFVSATEGTSYACGFPTANIAGGSFSSANSAPIAAYAVEDAMPLTAEVVSGGSFNKPIDTELVIEGFATVKGEGDAYVLGPDAVSGSGAVDDPWIIDGRRHLKAFRNGVNDGTYDVSSGAYVRQTADIDLRGEQWTDIGTGLAADGKIPFNGNYDGQDHVISNFVLSGASYCGFFNAMQAGSVRNLSLLDARSPKDCVAVSVLAGDVEPPDNGGKVVFENVTVGGTIAGTHNVGGFNAWLQGPVDFLSCTNLVDCTTTRAKTGGFTPYYGYGNAGVGLTMSNCCNRGTVTMHKSLKLDAVSAAGGLVAFSQSKAPMTFIECVNEGAVSVAMDDLGDVEKFYDSAYAGGIVGKITSTDPASFVSCVNKGAVSALVSNVTNENAYAGGIVGGSTAQIKLRIEDCTVTSDATVAAAGSDGKKTLVGAFVGDNALLAYDQASEKGLWLTGKAPTALAPVGDAEKAYGGANATKAEGEYTLYFIQLGPTVPAEEGTVTTVGEGAEAVATVEPKEDVTVVNVTLPEDYAGTVVVPVRLATVKGVPANQLVVKLNGLVVPNAAFVGGGAAGFSLALDPNVAPDVTVTVDGEAIPVKPTLTDADDTVVPFEKGDDVSVGVKTIPGFTYKLMRGETLGTYGTQADVQTAQGKRTALADANPPADKAFYVIQVEK